MRLLNIYTLAFTLFDDQDRIPRYMIASHRWGPSDAEVTLEDMQKGVKQDTSGYKKVEGFCEFLRKRNAGIEPGRRDKPVVEWLWIDTCCIDQKSSAEVQEAINSMWRWYRRAHICYAYLGDVDFDQLYSSAWFGRGWTLQELVAPRKVIFLNKTWNVIGHKCSDAVRGAFSCPHRRSGPALNELLTHMTSIRASVLLNTNAISECSLSERVGWLRNRRTKRREDMAYCLLGICGVYMSLIYGEGSNAWRRLEEEVSKRYGQTFQLDRPNFLIG